MVGLKRLLLVGAGHAHAQVLQRWITAPLPGVKLTVVSPSALAPYSGMVPGWLAGTYGFEEICINFRALAAAAGAQLLIDEVVGLDPARGSVQLASGGRMQSDVLSLNVGSTLVPPQGLAGQVLSLRPLGRLRAAWESMLPLLQAQGQHAPLQVTAVGGGAAGVESLLAVLATLRRQQPLRRFDGHLFSRSPGLLPGLAPGAARAAQAALSAAGVACHLGSDFDAAQACANGLLLWATGAQAHPWQRASGLRVSDAGFVAIDRQLRSLSHPQVFAVGDCAEWTPALPKAGVYAVRMGPVLWTNLRAALQLGKGVDYRPQRQVLALLATADGRAIISRGRLALSGPVLGRWAWRWKDRIDRGFLHRFEVG